MTISITARTLLRRSFPLKSISRLSRVKSISTDSDSSVDQHLHICTVESEPLYRYERGGYYPATLGEYLKSGRYKILHKLGWGGYSTVWAARDQRDGDYVAVKILIAEATDGAMREAQIMQKLASHHSHPRPKHVVHLLDNFELDSASGCHQCLVLEPLGPNIQDIFDSFPSGRLPGKLAKGIAKQSLIGLDVLHKNGIGHGDLHTRNLAFTLPYLGKLTEEQFIKMLGKPEIGHVRRRDGNILEPGIPRYVVRPTSHQNLLQNLKSAPTIKIIDFGQSFSLNTAPQTLHTPLYLRAPEILFKDTIDYRVDLWSMGCMLFELFTGQPPFDTLLVTPPTLIGQMSETASDDLPKRWQETFDTMNEDTSDEDIELDLPTWLEKVYFDGPHNTDLTQDDISRLGLIIGKLLYFEPSARASARQILDDPLFQE